MCAGLFLAVFDESAESLPIPPESEMTVWPVSNACVALAVGSACRTFMIGDGRHCSCGRARHTRDGYVLEEEASKLIADTADSYGEVAFVIHWFSGDFETEEFVAEPADVVTSTQMRSVARPYPGDRLFRVVGRNKPVA